MTPRTVPIVCALAPTSYVFVPAVRLPIQHWGATDYEWFWECSWCGARVKVVA